jgi:uncharacterized membrane protein YgdD (TMEM256/DUF423 family)
MHRTFLITAALLGALSVALGAFAAHGLRQVVPPDTVATFETGVRYQFYHVFALLAIAILYEKFPGGLLRWAGNCFLAGILLFSGSLYALTLLKATETVGVQKIGIITPFGGLFFIVGWLLLMVAVVRKV